MAHTADYGSLGPLVTTVGWLVSATAAIGMTWRRRAQWEPSEQDLATAPQKVGGVITAVALGIIWKRLNDSAYDELLTWPAIGFALGCLASLISYSILISTKTYIEQDSPAPGQVASKRIVGGFFLTAASKTQLAKRPALTEQDLLKGAGNVPNKVWTPLSRALAKSCFILGYLGLTVCGSVALASTAILLLPKERIRIVEENSGPRFSGIDDTWSPWYSISLPVAPKDYSLEKVEFWLTGDRQCNDGAECKEQSKGDSGVVELFRLKGHSGSGSPAQSEGHLKATYRPLP